MNVKDKISSSELLDNLPLPRDFLNRLGLTLNQAARKVVINAIEAESGSLDNVSIGAISTGGVTIENVKVADTIATLHDSAVQLQNVRTLIELGFTLHWKIDLGWIGSWSGNDNLGSVDIPFNLGNIDIPDLDNIELDIPSLNIPDVLASMEPISSLGLGKVALERAEVLKTRLPGEGFTVTGMGVGNASLTNVTVPSVDSQTATVKSVEPANNIVLPGLTLQNVDIPSTAIPAVSSGSFSTSATASDKSLGVDLGILEIALSITPTVHMDVAQLTASDLELSASIAEVAMQTINMPVAISNILVEGVDLKNISIDSVTL